MLHFNSFSNCAATIACCCSSCTHVKRLSCFLLIVIYLFVAAAFLNSQRQHWQHTPWQRRQASALAFINSFNQLVMLAVANVWVDTTAKKKVCTHRTARTLVSTSAFSTMSWKFTEWIIFKYNKHTLLLIRICLCDYCAEFVW